MDLSTIENSLALSGGTLTVGTNTFPAPFGDFLSNCFRQQAQEIVVSQATSTVDSARGTVTITGRGNYQDAPNLPVTATFSIGEGGAVQAIVAYDLTDPQAPNGAWKLSSVWKTMTGLDKLVMRTARIVVVSSACTDSISEVALPAAGIYYIGALVPGSLIGPLAATMDPSTTLTIHGPITIIKDETDIPMPSLGIDPSLPIQYPWTLAMPLPGILLEGKLGLDFKVGSLTLRDTALRIYAPPSPDWWRYDEIYRKEIVVTGTFAVPSADITIEAICRVDSGLAQVETRFTGISLGNLARLADLLGGDAGASLPSSLNGVVKALSSLALTDATFALAAGTSGLSLNWASATIGTQGAKWSIWKDDLVVTDIGLRFSVSDPLGAARSTDVALWGKLLIENTPMTVAASTTGDGYMLSATLDAGATLPLKSLMKKFAPSLSPPSDLTIDRMLLSYSTGPSGQLQFGASLAQAPQAWTIPVGPVPLSIENVLLDLWVPNSGSVGLMFRGDILFGKDVKLEMAYALPGELAIRADVAKMTLQGLIAQLSNQKVSLPSALDITLIDSTVVITADSSGSLLFRIATRVDGMGCFAFEARKVAGSWGFAGGLDLAQSSSSSVAGLSALSALEKLLHLSKFMLVVASYDDPGFQFPDLAQLQNPRIASGSLTLPGKGGVTQGLNVFAEWQLDAKDKSQNLLQKLLGLDGVLQVVIQVGPDPALNSRLQFSRSGTIQGHPFDFTVGVQLTSGSPSFYLTGIMTVKIQGQPQTFALTTVFVPGGAFLSANMTGSTPVDFKVFKLSNVGLLIGVDWAGLPSLGLVGTIDVKKFESSIAVFFDSADPGKSLVAGSVSSLTMKDIIDSLAGKVGSSSVDDFLSSIAIKGTGQFNIPDIAGDLDSLNFDKVASAFAGAKVKIPAESSQLLLNTNQKGALWHLTDMTNMRHYQLKKNGDAIEVSIEPQFYFAPEQTAVGTIRFPQGFYLNAAFSFAGFDASATIDISVNNGISIDAQMDKISLLDDKIFSIAADKGGGGPKLSVSSFAQPNNPVAEFRQPHFYINGALTLLGIKEGIYANVSSQGVDFSLQGELVPGVQFDVDARFGKAGFGASGSAKVGIGTIDLGSLGKAKINTKVEVTLDIDIDMKPSSVSIDKGAGFSPNATVLENELARLVFQGDGNLVLYRESGTDWEPVWASNTAGKGANSLSFQGDGNLVLYASGHPVWASNTAGRNGTRLVLQDDLNLVLYDNNGKPLWASNTGGIGASVALESSFDFAGAHYKIEKFKLSASPDSLSKLVTTIYDKMKDALLGDYKDATKWLNAQKNGLIDGVNDSKKVLTSVYHKSDKEASDLVNAGTKAVDHAVNSAVKSTENTAKKTIKKMKFW